MGSTFVDFNSKGFEANDAQIEIWLLLLVAEIEKLTHPPDWLEEARREWHLQATSGFGFGVMPGLDGIVTSTERRDVLLDLSSKAMKRLRGYGPRIRKEELNAIQGSNESGYYTDDVETALFESMGDHFVKLLRGDLGPHETDARIFP